MSMLNLRKPIRIFKKTPRIFLGLFILIIFIATPSEVHSPERSIITNIQNLPQMNKDSSNILEPLELIGNQAIQDFCENQTADGKSWNTAYRLENLHIMGYRAQRGLYLKDISVYVIIENCTVINSAESLYYSGAIYIENCRNIRIQNNSPAANFDNGIFIKQSTKIEVINNTMNTQIEDGIHVLQSNYCIVANNTVTANVWYGVCIKQTNHTQVYSNRISYNEHHGLHLEVARNISVKTNTIHNNEGYGLNLMQVIGSNFENNTLYNNTKGPIGEYGSSDNIFDGSRHDLDSSNIQSISGLNLPFFMVNVIILIGILIIVNHGNIKATKRH